MKTEWKIYRRNTKSFRKMFCGKTFKEWTLISTYDNLKDAKNDFNSLRKEWGNKLYQYKLVEKYYQNYFINILMKKMILWKKF